MYWASRTIYPEYYILCSRRDLYDGCLVPHNCYFLIISKKPRLKTWGFLFTSPPLPYPTKIRVFRCFIG